MKLSEAIRLGAMMGPQLFDGFFGGPLFRSSTCALGSGLLAIGKSVQYSDNCFVELWNVWPWLDEVKSNCPACGRRDDADLTIAHLNDEHRWTRERIADWVASIEPQEEQAEVAGQGTREELAQRVEA